MSISALALAPESEWVEWAGTRYRVPLPASSSNGLISMFEGVVPAGEGPPVHIHHNEDEVIHVLEGRYRFWLDGGLSELGPGECVFLPRGVPHTFQVISRTPGRNLAILTPGGFEAFFPIVGGEGLRIPADMARITEVASRFGIEFTGPPLAQL